MSAQRTNVRVVTGESLEPDVYGIKARRERLGWSRRELALRAGTAEQTIANLEQRPRSKRKPSTLAAVVSALAAGETPTSSPPGEQVSIAFDAAGRRVVTTGTVADATAAAAELLRRLADQESSERPT